MISAAPIHINCKPWRPVRANSLPCSSLYDEAYMFSQPRKTNSRYSPIVTQSKRLNIFRYATLQCAFLLFHREGNQFLGLLYFVQYASLPFHFFKLRVHLARRNIVAPASTILCVKMQTLRLDFTHGMYRKFSRCRCELHQHEDYGKSTDARLGSKIWLKR